MGKRPAHENLARQWRVLQAIAAEPRTVSSLAREHGVSKATIQRDIDTLARVFVVSGQLVEGQKQRRLYTAVIA